MTIKSPDKERFQEIILDRMMKGESLVRICKDKDLPSIMTVFRWLEDDQVFRDDYARARSIQADTVYDSMVDIEEDTLGDRVKTDAARVVLWSRQWRAGKLAPKKYSEKLQVGGSDELPAIRIQHDPGDAVRRIAFLLDKAARNATD
jgi:hypothetical protein